MTWNVHSAGKTRGWKLGEMDILLATYFKWLEAEMEQVTSEYCLHQLALVIAEDVTFTNFKVAINQCTDPDVLSPQGVFR